MKNASYHHVVQAQPNSGNMLPTNVVFLVAHPQFEYPIKAHIKRHIWNDSKIYEGLLMEDMNGFKFVAKAEWLSPVPRKMGTPAKPKRKPLKGSKPWLANYVVYDPSLIKDGVKVLCRNGVVLNIDFTNELCSEDYYYMSSFHLSSGKNKHNDCWDIVKVFVDPANKQLNEPKQQRNTAMKQAHNAAYGGYEVGKWHFWQGASLTPPVADDVRVRVWLRDDCNCVPYIEPSRNWNWKWNSCDSDIIAFYIIEEQ